MEIDRNSLNYNTQISQPPLNKSSDKSLSHLVPVPSSSSHPKSLEERVSKLPPIDRYVKEPSLQLNPAETAEVTRELQKGQWKSEIFIENREKFPHHTLAAYKEGLIEKGQLCTSLIYYSLLKYHSPEEIKILPLFDAEGNPIQESVKILKATFKVPEELVEEVKITENLTDESFERFLAEMKGKPLSEQQIFTFPDIQRGSQKPTISQQINFRGLNMFSRYEEGMRMFPSFSMMQAFLNAKFDEPVVISPTIDMSSLGDIIQNGKDKTREMAFPFPGVTLPTIVDALPAPQEYDVIYHDFYHAYIASSIPQEQQRSFIKLAEVVDGLQSDEKVKEMESFLSLMRDRLIDMDHGEYSEFAQSYDRPPLPEECFWHSLLVAEDVAFFMLPQKERNSEVRKTIAENFLPLFAEKIFSDRESLHGVDFHAVENIARYYREGIEKSFAGKKNKEKFAKLVEEKCNTNLIILLDNLMKRTELSR